MRVWGGVDTDALLSRIDHTKKYTFPTFAVAAVKVLKEI